MLAKGVLLDIDGALYVGDDVVDGAPETLELLQANDLSLRLLTNTTTEPSSVILARLGSLGFRITPEELITAPAVAIRFLRQRRAKRCYFVLRAELRQAFSEFESSESDPDYIIMGDVEDQWNYPLLNRVFGMMMAGAELVALHKGKYSQVKEGLKMDIGAFVAGLEYVTGKPSREFYQLAVRSLGLEAFEVIMVGDDIHSDVGGAQQAGLKGVLVKTGKYREDVTLRSDVEPDAVLKSIADVPSLLGLEI